MNCECKFNPEWPGGIHQCAEHGRWARELLKELRERCAKIAEEYDPCGLGSCDHVDTACAVAAKIREGK